MSYSDRRSSHLPFLANRFWRFDEEVKGGMVYVDDYEPSQQMLSILLQPIPHAKQLLVHDAVTPFHIRQSATGISDDMPLIVLLLLEYGTKRHARGVSVDNVLSFIAWRHKDWCEDEPILELKKGFLTVLAPVKCCIFSETGCAAKSCTKAL